MVFELRRPEAGGTDHELLWGLVALGLVACTSAIVFLELPLPPCLFHAVVGLPCPTCGMTRALYALAQGRVLDSLRLHPLVPPGTVAVLCYGLYAGTTVGFGLPRLHIRAESIDWTALRRVVVGAVTCLWLYLIVDGR